MKFKCDFEMQHSDRKRNYAETTYC